MTKSHQTKPTHVKPSFYGCMFEPMKEIALKYGYNLVLHGSLNRDMDLIAIPWEEETGSIDDMLSEFCEYTGGKIHNFVERIFTEKPHGRIAYVIDIYRGGYSKMNGFTEWTFYDDPQTYIDISIMPTVKSNQ